MDDLTPFVKELSQAISIAIIDDSLFVRNVGFPQVRIPLNIQLLRQTNEIGQLFQWEISIDFLSKNKDVNEVITKFLEGLQKQC